MYATSQSGTGVAISRDGVYAACSGDRSVAGMVIDSIEHSLRIPVREIGVSIHV